METVCYHQYTKWRRGMKCHKCGKEITEEEFQEYLGKINRQNKGCNGSRYPYK